MIQAFFTIKSGFSVSVPLSNTVTSESKHPQLEIGPIHTVQAFEIREWLKDGSIELSQNSNQIIKGMIRRQILDKSIPFIQVASFLLEYMSRFIHALSFSKLEIATVAYVSGTITSYSF